MIQNNPITRKYLRKDIKRTSEDIFSHKEILIIGMAGVNMLRLNKLVHLKRDSIKRIVKEEGLVKMGYFCYIEQDSLTEIRFFFIPFTNKWFGMGMDF